MQWGLKVLSVGSLVVAGAAGAQTLPVGTLVHDGPPTPEQISLNLPITGALGSSATASVRYRTTSGPGAWVIGHPLYRVQPGQSETPQAGGAVQSSFAWTILGLTPGTSYDVEVTVTDGAISNVVNLTTSTRLLPGPCGAPNKTANSAGSIATQIAGLVAGDVLEIATGTFTVSNLTVNDSGAVGNPICIRGASRTGTILSDTTGAIFDFEASNIILENLTLRGSNSDGGVSSGHTCLQVDTDANYSNITMRNLTCNGTDKGIAFIYETNGTLVYDNTITGNNTWTSAQLNNNDYWDDEGIQVTGYGTAIFNNTLIAFGDCLVPASHFSGAQTDTSSWHAYRNEIRLCGDDAIEFDHSRRNVTVYDNRWHNAMTCDSFDPGYGGPFIIARNICINPGSVNLHKWNSNGSGWFFYNNTYLATNINMRVDQNAAIWYLPNSTHQNYGYRNNVHISSDTGLDQMLWFHSSDDNNPVDFTHNSWFPNNGIQMKGGAWGNLAAAQSGISNSSPVFGSFHSPSNRPLNSDNITTSSPWVTAATLGASSSVQVTATYSPTPNHASLLATGVAIPNITDGFSGAAPDRGAIISGRPMTVWGDRGFAAGVPNPPTNLTVN